MKTLGIVIPTLNSMPVLPGHLQALARWQDLAAQIVAVDSFSTDGTADFLRQRLKHPNVSFLSHPPGLYQSWNFGIQQLTTDYACVATVGDTLTREGALHLLQHAESLDADALISKPVFMADEANAVPDIRWPIDDLIETLAVTRPRALSWAEVLLFTALHLDGTLLGSSASNFYRTATLQKFPFPSDFGKAGDAAWGIRHFADAKWAVTPEKFSTFLRHPDWTAAADRQSWKVSARLDRVLRDAVESATAGGNIPPAAVKAYAIPELLDAISRWLDGKQAFDLARTSSWPWYLNPAAWQSRAGRNQSNRLVRQWRERALARLKKDCAAGSSTPESNDQFAAGSAGPKPG